MYTALVVDDHPFIRTAVVMLLSQERFETVAETNNGADAVQLARQHQPDLIVLDIGLPKLDGLEVIRRIKALKLPSKILVLTSQLPTFYASRCRSMGADGYICKVDEPQKFREALTTVMSGYTVFPSLETDSVRRGDQDASDQHLISALSNRELVVLQQLARGMSNLQIGELMLLSNKNIGAYKKRLLSKLKLTSQVGLADFAKRNALI